MKKIDKYILGKYLTTFFFCLILFTVIVVVVDLSEKADDFVKSQLSAWRIVTDYYVGFIPRLDAMLFPLFVFLAVIFFTSKMAERSEIIAILSSGVSFSRFLRPYWMGGFILGLLLWVTNHFVLPDANRIWGEFEAKYINFNQNNVQGPTQNLYFRIDPNTYAGIKYYDTLSKSGNSFFIQRFKQNQLEYNLRSERINWDTAAKKWNLQNVTERYIKGEHIDLKRAEKKLVTYNFTPVDIKRDDYLKDRLSTKELNDFIRAEQLRGSENVGSLLVERYNRDAIPASVIILTLIGGILASKKVRGGSGFHIAIGLVLSVLYILFSRFTGVFAVKGNFPPLLAAWIPNMLFAGLALYLYKKAPK